MIVDTSVIVAIAARESGWERALATIEAASSVGMSSVSALECTIVLTSPRFGLLAEQVRGMLDALEVAILDFTAQHADVGAAAYSRYGRGNHPARLNFGDCAAYATARLADTELLYVGDDFAQTDIGSAMK